MKLEPRSSFERGFYFRNGEQDTLALLNEFLRPGDVFADCGANLGLMTLFASRCVAPGGHVYAFEPTPMTFDRLSEHLTLNGCTNVTAFRMALGAAPGSASILQPSVLNHGMNFVGTGPRGDVEDVGASEVCTIDALIESGRMKPPQFIKIDTEGSELRILEGSHQLCGSAHAPRMLIELSRWTTARFGYEPEAIITYLQAIRPYTIEWRFLGRTLRVDATRPLPHYAVLGRDHGANYLFTPVGLGSALR